MNFDKELDARGLNCPLPILRTKKSLNEMSSGQVLKIIATDPGAVKDFQAFSKQTGNELLSSSQASGEFMFFIKKNKRSSLAATRRQARADFSRGGERSGPEKIGYHCDQGYA